MVNIFLVKKMCIYSCVMIITQTTTVLITRGPVQWRGQLVMHHVYITGLHHVHMNCTCVPLTGPRVTNTVIV